MLHWLATSCGGHGACRGLNARSMHRRVLPAHPPGCRRRGTCTAFGSWSGKFSPVASPERARYMASVHPAGPAPTTTAVRPLRGAQFAVEEVLGAQVDVGASSCETAGAIILFLLDCHAWLGRGPSAAKGTAPLALNDGLVRATTLGAEARHVLASLKLLDRRSHVGCAGFNIFNGVGQARRHATGHASFVNGTESTVIIEAAFLYMHKNLCALLFR